MRNSHIFSNATCLLLMLLLIQRTSELRVVHQGAYFPNGRYHIKLGNYYLAVNNPVGNNSDERAFFGTKDYIEADAGRYSKEVWLQRTSDGKGYYIKSKFGSVDSFLYVDGLVRSGSYQNAYFGSYNYIYNRSNSQYSYWIRTLSSTANQIYIGQGPGGVAQSILSMQANTGDYDWAYFFSTLSWAKRSDMVQFIPLDNYVETCESDQWLSGNSAAFFMTSDPQFRFGNAGGRKDGDINSINTYNFLKSQVLSKDCPQTFIGIAGDLNFQKTDYQDTFLDKFQDPSGRKKLIADIIGNHDRVRLSNFSMVEKTRSSLYPSDLFYYSQSVKVKWPQARITLFDDNQPSYYNTQPAAFYTLELSTKTKPTQPVAYVVMTNNQLQKNVWYLNHISSQPDFNKNLPIILVGHAIWNFNNATELAGWIIKNKVVLILGGHYFCQDAYSNDHCDRRSAQERFVWDLAFYGKELKYVNTSGVRDRVFWTISVNENTVLLKRKAWTKGQRLPGMQAPNPPITIKF